MFSSEFRSYYSWLGVGWLRFFKYFEKFRDIDVISVLSQNFSKYSKNRNQPTPSHPLYNNNTAYTMEFGCELVEKNWSAHFLTTGEYMHVLYKLRRGHRGLTRVASPHCWSAVPRRPVASRADTCTWSSAPRLPLSDFWLSLLDPCPFRLDLSPCPVSSGCDWLSCTQISSLVHPSFSSILFTLILLSSAVNRKAWILVVLRVVTYGTSHAFI